MQVLGWGDIVVWWCRELLRVSKDSLPVLSCLLLLLVYLWADCLPSLRRVSWGIRPESSGSERTPPVQMDLDGGWAKTGAEWGLK